MMYKQVTYLTLTAFTALAGVAAAQTTAFNATSSPVAITAAEILSQPPAQINENGSYYGDVRVNSLDVAFVNTAPVAATEVTFSAQYNGTTQLIRERGNFAPQVPIERIVYRGFSDLEYQGSNVSLSVAAIHFADGTDWSVGKRQQ